MSEIDPKVPPKGRQRFWLMVCLGCATFAFFWGGAIESANYQAGFPLPSVVKVADGSWANVFASRDDVAVAYPQASDEEVDALWADHVRRNRLYRLMIGFGPVAYLLSITGLASAITAFRKGGTLPRTLAGVAGLMSLIILARMIYLGVLRYGLIDYLT